MFINTFEPRKSLTSYLEDFFFQSFPRFDSTCTTRTSVWAKSLYDNYEANYPLSPEANACSKSYSLPLNTIIRLQAVSTSDCTINIYTSANSATWLVVEIRRREGNPNYSTFFVQNISEEDSENAADITSLPFSDCKVKLLGKSST